MIKPQDEARGFLVLLGEQAGGLNGVPLCCTATDNLAREKILAVAI